MQIKGLIKDGKTSAPMEGVRIELTVSGQQIAVLSSDRNGQFEKGLEADLWGQTLAWTMTQEGYLNQQGSLQADREEIPLEVALESKEVVGPTPVPIAWWRRHQTWYIAIASVLLLVAIVVFIIPVETTEPETTEPETTEPEITEPEITEPEITEPEITEPEITEPEITEPEPVTPDKVTVPNVKGYHAKKARRSLRQAGFVNVEIKERYSQETTPGHVLFTKPEAGSIVALSGAIRLVVATDVKYNKYNKTLCGEWCNDARNSCQCKHEKYGCDDGFKITKRFSEGLGDDWYACGRETSSAVNETQLSQLKKDLAQLQKEFFALFPSDLDAAEANLDQTMVRLRLIRSYPDDLDLQNVRAYTHKNYAMVMRRRGRAEEFSDHLTKSQKVFKLILKHKRNDARAWNGLGSVALLRREPEKALKYIDKALKLDPNYESARRDRETAVKMIEQK